MIFNILVPCVRLCTPAYQKKHYKIRRFLSFLLSQAPLSKPRPHPGLAPRQGWEPIGSNFHRSVPIYSKRNHSQNHHKVRDQYIEKKKQYIGTQFLEKIKMNIMVPCFAIFQVVGTILWVENESKPIFY